MNLFVQTHYRRLIRQLVQQAKDRGSNLTLEKLAQAARMQKAHLTNVLNGRANLQLDQMYMMAPALGLEDAELRYIELLIEIDRSKIPSRRKRLEEELEQLREKHLRTESHLAPNSTPGLDAAFPEYYLDPLHQLVHMALSIESYARDPNALAARLKISAARMDKILARLEKHRVIVKKAGRYQNLIKNLHLKKDSPYYRAWRSQITHLAQHGADESLGNPSYGFTSVFSADTESARLLQAKILELIQQAQKDLRAAPAKNIFQFSIDLVTWA